MKSLHLAYALQQSPESFPLACPESESRLGGDEENELDNLMRAKITGCQYGFSENRNTFLQGLVFPAGREPADAKKYVAGNKIMENNNYLCKLIDNIAAT